MYNGIGLPTARGSGTNGYIQRNNSYIRPRNQHFQGDRQSAPSLASRQPNKDILMHDKKRQIEVKCAQLQEMLLNKGSMSVEEVEKEVSKLRQELLQGLESMEIKKADEIKVHEVHYLAEAKKEENQRMAQALGIGNDQDYVEGSAFDPEIQEQKKQQRILERERQRLEREERRMRKKRGRERSRSIRRHRSESPSRSQSRSRSRRRRRSPSYSRSRSRDERRTRYPSHRSRSRSYEDNRERRYRRRSESFSDEEDDFEVRKRDFRRRSRS